MPPHSPQRPKPGGPCTARVICEAQTGRGRAAGGQRPPGQRAVPEGGRSMRSTAAARYVITSGCCTDAAMLCIIRVPKSPPTIPFGPVGWQPCPTHALPLPQPRLRPQLGHPCRCSPSPPAGQIGYAICPMIARGAMLGPDQPVILHMLDIEPAKQASGQRLAWRS